MSAHALPRVAARRRPPRPPWWKRVAVLFCFCASYAGLLIFVFIMGYSRFPSTLAAAAWLALVAGDCWRLLTTDWPEDAVPRTPPPPSRGMLLALKLSWRVAAALWVAEIALAVVSP